jgi:regulatory protein YycH of two-component signal transduction system YycFG
VRKIKRTEIRLAMLTSLLVIGIVLVYVINAFGVASAVQGNAEVVKIEVVSSTAIVYKDGKVVNTIKLPKDAKEIVIGDRDGIIIVKENLVKEMKEMKTKYQIALNEAIKIIEEQKGLKVEEVRAASVGWAKGKVERVKLYFTSGEKHYQAEVDLKNKIVASFEEIQKPVIKLRFEE